MPAPYATYIGDRHNRRTVLSLDGIGPGGHQMVTVRCDCGRVKPIPLYQAREHGCGSCRHITHSKREKVDRIERLRTILRLMEANAPMSKISAATGLSPATLTNIIGVWK